MSVEQEIKIFDTPEQLAENFAIELKALINQGVCHMALSGGSTPALLFQELAKKHADSIQWSNVNFYWGDERCVNPESSDSNFKMTQELLFNHIAIPQENIHRIRGESAPEAEALRYEQLILKKLPIIGTMPQFDMVILGMGTDGHTASIFPNQMDLLITEKLCEVAHHPETGQQRVTFTGQLINHAKKVVFLVTGSSKAEKIDSIIHQKGNFLQYPAAHIQPYLGSIYWYLDNPAASLL